MTPAGTVERALSATLVALLLGGLCIAALTLRDEWNVALSQRALDAQMLAIQQRGDPPPPPTSRIDPALPARAQINHALYLARSADFLPSPERKAMLDEAAAAVGRAVIARPHWGEAWTVSAFVHAQRHGVANIQVQRAFARSYADAPYLRHSARWRTRFGLESWPMLTAETRRRVINEAIWLTRVSPAERKDIFSAFRQSPAYVPFLLRWRQVRVGDTDIAKRLAWEKIRSGESAAP